MTDLAKIVAEARAGRLTLLTRADLDSQFVGSDIKRKWTAMQAWARQNDLAWSVHDGIQSDMGKTEVRFWSSLPKL